MTCHCCDGPTKRFGRFENKNRIVQRYRCNRCGKTFSESQSMDGVRVETEKTVQVVNMLCEGLGIRSTSRLSGLNQRTVLNILKTGGEHCRELLNNRLQKLSAEPVEVDECWTFAGNKRGRRNTPEAGDFYVFLASGKNTKLIMAHIVGKRDDTVADEFIFTLKNRLPDRFQITSDSYGGFVRGVLDNVEQADYAVQMKRYEAYNASMKDSSRRYSPGKCVSVKTKHMRGNPEWKDITTSHAERLNLSMRHFNKRFTRLSPCFSKKYENLVLSVEITVAFFNFCRTHKTLKIKATDADPSIERTPAMAARLTDHIWTVDELLSADQIESVKA